MIDRSFAAMIFKARKCIDVDGNLFLDEKMILRNVFLFFCLNLIKKKSWDILQYFCGLLSKQLDNLFLATKRHLKNKTQKKIVSYLLSQSHKNNAWHIKL